MKILCIRLSAIGDLLVCTPVFRALQQQLQAEVHVLTKAGPAQVLLHNPHVARVIHWGEAGARVGELRKEGYDVVVDLHCNLRSHRLRLALGVPALGYRKRNLSKRLLGHGIDRLGDEHLVDRYFKALAPLGIRYDGGGLDYYNEEALAWPPEHVASLDAAEREGAVALVLGATHATKRMPAELLVSLCEGLRGRVVLLGGDDVTDFAAEVMGQLANDTKVLNLCGRLSLRQSAQVLAWAGAVITPDTGLMHIAAALHRPMVVVWGNTVPAYGMYPLLPVGLAGRVAYAEVTDLNCRPCSRIGYVACPRGHFACMHGQSVAGILAAVEKVRRAGVVGLAGG